MVVIVMERMAMMCVDDAVCDQAHNEFDELRAGAARAVQMEEGALQDSDQTATQNPHFHSLCHTIQRYFCLYNKYFCCSHTTRYRMLRRVTVDQGTAAGTWLQLHTYLTIYRAPYQHYQHTLTLTGARASTIQHLRIKSFRCPEC